MIYRSRFMTGLIASVRNKTRSTFFATSICVGGARSGCPSCIITTRMCRWFRKSKRDLLLIGRWKWFSPRWPPLGKEYVDTLKEGLRGALV